jgi:archaellum component FlaG (FlaF/FlaG flagellin family)
MRRSIMILFTVTFLLAASSCAGMGDAVLRIKGSVVDVRNTPLSDCTLELHLSEDNASLDKERINGDFQATFVIAPQTYNYFMTVRCAGKNSIYKSAIYRINGATYRGKTLDLGTIVLQ